MRITLKITALAVLLFVVAARCKKSSSPAANARMSGTRTWVQTTVNSYVDSIGTRHHDTTYSTFSTHIDPLSSTTILIYLYSGTTHADTLTSVTSNATGILSFAMTSTVTSITGSMTTISTRYDSVAYKNGTDSMTWYNGTFATQPDLVIDSIYTISHTP